MSGRRQTDRSTQIAVAVILLLSVYSLGLVVLLIARES